MGLRDRKPSRVRDRDLRTGRQDDARILAGRAVEAMRRLGARLTKRIRSIDLPGIVAGDAPAAGGPEHFAETMVGGIAITFGILVAVMLLLWIGTFL